MTQLDLDLDATALGEDLCVPERLIAAPMAGVFQLPPPETAVADPTEDSEIVRAGQVVGSIDRNDGSVDVVNPHTGFLMGLLVLPGERVREGQPLAWVRVFT